MKRLRKLLGKNHIVENEMKMNNLRVRKMPHNDLLLSKLNIKEMVHEDTEDFQKFGGNEELDFSYTQTPFLSMVRKRAGWLIVLFVSEMLTASAMSYFDDELAKAVVLALFVPLIISSGGNSGSQAASLIIRALALDEIKLKDWWQVMRKEILSGLCLGLILGGIGFVRIWMWQSSGLYGVTCKSVWIDILNLSSFRF